VTVDDLKRLSAELFAPTLSLWCSVRSSRVTAMTTRVGVIGAYGKMGELICKAVENEPEMALVAKVGASDLKDSRRERRRGRGDVTNAQAAEQNLPWLALHEIHAVVGTSESVTTGSMK